MKLDLTEREIMADPELLREACVTFFKCKQHRNRKSARLYFRRAARATTSKDFWLNWAQELHRKQVPFHLAIKALEAMDE